MSRDLEPSARLDDDNPWPGLFSFRETDHHYFGGRDAAIEELLRRVIAEPLTLVFGPSGLGKTSLLRAGLFPQLRREHFFPVYIRLEYVSGRSPLQQIKEEIVKQAAEWNVEATPPDDNETLWEYLHRRDVDFWDERNFPAKPVLVFDQFEELFTKGKTSIGDLTDTLSPLTEGSRPKSVRSALADDQSLQDRYHNRRRYRVVLSIREDYVAQLYALSNRLRSVFTNWFPVQRMTGDDALISTKKAGHKVLDEAVARRVIRFVGGIKNDQLDESVLPVNKVWIDPALLSVICKELNEARKKAGAPKITTTMLADRKEAILKSFLDDSFAIVSPELTKFVEMNLVLDGKTRDSIAVKKATDQGISEVDIGKLVTRGVLRPVYIDGVARIELTHDLLTSEIAARRTRREALEEAQKAEEAKLAAAREATEQAEWERETAQKAQEDAEKSRDAAKRDLRKTQTAFGALVALFIAALAFGLYIRFMRAETRRKEARDLFRSANRAFDDKRDDEALAYLAQALRVDPTNDTARTLVYDRLLRGGWWVPVSSMAIDGRDLQEERIVISPDGDKVLVIGEGRVSLWDLANGKRVNEVPVSSEFSITAHFLRNPRFVRISASPSRFLWDTEGTSLRPIPPGGDVRPDGGEIVARTEKGIEFIDLATNVRTEIDRPFTAIRYAAHPRRFLVVVRGEERGTFHIWDRTTGVFVGERISSSAPVRSVTLTADGLYLIITDVRRAITIWDIETGKQAAGLRGGDQLIISSTGSELVTTSGNEARIFSSQGNLERTLLHEDRVSSVVYDSDDTRILTTSEDGTVRCWDSSGNLIGAPLSHRVRNVRAQFKRDGSIVTVSDRVRVWRRVQVFDEPLIAVPSVYPESLNSAGQLAIFEEMSDEPRHIAMSLVDGTKRWETSAKGTSSLAVSPGNRFVAFARAVEKGERIKVFLADGATGEELWDQDFAGETVVTASFAERDATLVVLTTVVGRNDTDARIRFLSTHTGKEIAPAMGVKHVNMLTVAPAGSLLAIVDSENRATLWDWKNRTKIGPSIAKVETLRFSDNGLGLIASLQENQGVRVYEVGTTLRQTARLETDGQVDILAFSPDGRSTITSSAEVVISGVRGKRRRRPIAGALAAPPRFSANGKRAAIVFADDTAQVCDLDTGWPVTRPLPIDSDSESLALMSTDGNSLFFIRDRMLVRAPVPQGTQEESPMLVKLAEAIAGKQVSDDDFDTLDSSAKMEELAKECTGKSDRPCRFVQWFHRGHTKTISPLSSWTYGQYSKFKPISPEEAAEEAALFE